MGTWKKIGEIGVDSSLCWLGDPCYILKKDQTGLECLNLETWTDFCNHLGDEYPTAKQFDYTKGHAGLGVCLSTGYGDGCYDVLAKFEETKELGKRIAEVKIVFISSEPEAKD